MNFSLIFSSTIFFGLLSIAISIWYKIEIRKDFETRKIPFFEYKQSKIVWSSVGIGLTAILVARGLESQLKILIFTIGLYLVLYQVVEFISGKYFKTNILAFNDEYLIDLNGGIKRVYYKDIKSYKNEKGIIRIREKGETYRIKQKNFMNSESMFEDIENNYFNRVSDTK